MDRKIKYVKHPVSPEQKAKLVSEGYKIIDERFKPEGYQEDKPKAKKKAKAKE